MTYSTTGLIESKQAVDEPRLEIPCTRLTYPPVLILVDIATMSVWSLHDNVTGHDAESIQRLRWLAEGEWDGLRATRKRVRIMGNLSDCKTNYY